MRSIIDFEDFYNEMIKNDPLFFKDYCLSISYGKNSSIIMKCLNGYEEYKTFSCKINLNNKKDIKKYFEKFNFFSTLDWKNTYAQLINIESIKDLLNNEKSDYTFLYMEDNKQLVFANNEKNNKAYLRVYFSPKRFKSYLTAEEKEKLNIQIKILEFNRRTRITEKYKQNYEESKRKLEEMKSNLTEKEKLLLTLRGII